MYVDPDVEELTPSQVEAQKAKVSKLQEDLLKHEEGRHEHTYIPYGSGGRLAGMEGMHDLLKEAVQNAMNNLLPLEMFFEQGVYPKTKAAEREIAGAALAKAIKEPRFKHIRARFEDKNDKKWFNTITDFVSVRNDSA